MNDAAGRSAAEVARAYFDSQNRRDIDGLMTLFGEDGACTDPDMGPISGEELREFFAGSFEAFSDISFEVDELFEGEGGRTAAQWRMRIGAPRPSGSASSPPTGLDRRRARRRPPPVPAPARRRVRRPARPLTIATQVTKP